MAILTFLETHSAALILLTATTMFALIIIMKIHSVRTDLDRAIKALPKNSGNNSGASFDGLNDQIEQMAVEIVALKNEGVSKSFVDDANALAQPTGRTRGPITTAPTEPETKTQTEHANHRQEQNPGEPDRARAVQPARMLLITAPTLLPTPSRDRRGSLRPVAIGYLTQIG